MNKEKSMYLLLVAVTLAGFCIIHLKFNEICEYQDHLEDRINSEVLCNRLEDTRSAEHRYFMLLHQCFKKGVLEEKELEYYKHLKQFYTIGE